MNSTKAFIDLKYQTKSLLKQFADKIDFSIGWRKRVYEIKVSRQDFLKDIKSKKKQRKALAFSNQFFYIAPKSLIDPDELPVWAGLIEVYYNKNNALVKRLKIDAPYRESLRPSWSFMCSLVRNVQRRYQNDTEICS